MIRSSHDPANARPAHARLTFLYASRPTREQTLLTAISGALPPPSGPRRHGSDGEGQPSTRVKQSEISTRTTMHDAAPCDGPAMAGGGPSRRPLASIARPPRLGRLGTLANARCLGGPAARLLRRVSARCGSLCPPLHHPCRGSNGPTMGHPETSLLAGPAKGALSKLGHGLHSPPLRPGHPREHYRRSGPMPLRRAVSLRSDIGPAPRPSLPPLRVLRRVRSYAPSALRAGSARGLRAGRRPSSIGPERLGSVRGLSVAAAPSFRPSPGRASGPAPAPLRGTSAPSLCGLRFAPPASPPCGGRDSARSGGPSSGHVAGRAADVRRPAAVEHVPTGGDPLLPPYPPLPPASRRRSIRNRPSLDTWA